MAINGMRRENGSMRATAVGGFLLAWVIATQLAAATEPERPGTESRADWLAPHAPIRIDSNGGFTGANGVSGGAGTQANPYVIEGWEINGTGAGYALYIGNTTAWFVVRNCTVTDASGGAGDTWRYDVGVTLYGVSNGRLENVTASRNGNDGVKVSSSRLVSVLGVNSSRNGGAGLYIPSSNNVTVGGSSFWYNGYAGIVMSSSVDSFVTGSTSNRNRHGIALSLSKRNILEDSFFIENQDSGMDLTDKSDRNSLKDNTVRGNRNGIFLSQESAFNNVLGNTVNASAEKGVFLWWGKDNLIQNNTVSGSGSAGIWLDYLSARNRIVGNQVIWNSGDGLYAESASRTEINENWFRNNTGYGVKLFDSSPSNKVHHNEFLGNRNGGKQGYDNLASNFWNDTVIGNHWDDYDQASEGCLDASPANGICDSPYSIPGSTARDNFPSTTVVAPEGLSPPSTTALAIGLLATASLLAGRSGKRRVFA
jgi:parallel beta-helix repeat protein